MSTGMTSQTTSQIPAVREVNGRVKLNTHRTSDLPPAVGRHALRIETCELAESGPQAKNPGSPYLKTRLRIIDGPDTGKAIWQNFQLEGGFRFLFEQLTRAVGLDGRDDVEESHFIGAEFEAEIQHREFNGDMRGELKKIFVEGDTPGVVATGASATQAALTGRMGDLPF